MGEMGLPCLMTTEDRAIKLASLQKADSPSWARFLMHLRQTVSKDRRLIFIDGEAYTANINWLRDHIHELKGFLHWEKDLKSYLGFMIRNQNEEGFFYEMAVTGDNCHLSFVEPRFTKCFPEDGIGLVRVELEADIEYLAVEGVTEVYKATGDEDWVRQMLPYLEKGIDYMTSNPKRWNSEYGLVIRPFTIDTWDFAYGQSDTDRCIHPETPMSVFHGDNSGIYQAMKQLGWLNRRLGKKEKAEEWESRAEQIKKNLDRLCWNGLYYTHTVPIGHPGAEGSDETEILSLSNTYAINRGITDKEQAQSILSEYQKRRDTTDAFAEWFSIDPPYPRFKRGDGSYWGEGAYINGGITSFTAGELAKAAFQNGFEEYGWDILCRIRQKVFEDGELYFLYDRKSGKNIAGGPSGWGAAAVLDAVDKGLAGITDEDICFRKLGFTPRWAVTDLKEIRYITGYEVSRRLIETRYRRTEKELFYELLCPSETIHCHILLPKGRNCTGITVNGENTAFTSSRIRQSLYTDFTVEGHRSVQRESGWDKPDPIRIAVTLR